MDAGLDATAAMRRLLLAVLVVVACRGHDDARRLDAASPPEDAASHDAPPSHEEAASAPRRDAAGDTATSSHKDAGGDSATSSRKDATLDAVSDAAHASDADASDAGSTIDAEPNVAVTICPDAWSGCAFDSPCDGCCLSFFCVSEGEPCGQDAGTCVQGSCRGTGATGQACFHGNVYTGGYTTSNSPEIICGYTPWVGCTDTVSTCGPAGECVRCGAPGEPCCGDAKQCVAGTFCDLTLTCFLYDDDSTGCGAATNCKDDGWCEPCGEATQACCGDGGCLLNQGYCRAPNNTCVQITP